MCVNIGHADDQGRQGDQDQAAVLLCESFMATEPRARLGAKLATSRQRHRLLLLHQRRRRANENASRLARWFTGPRFSPATARIMAAPPARSQLTATPGDGPPNQASPVSCVPDPYHGIQRGWDSASDARRSKIVQLEGRRPSRTIREPVTGTNGVLVPPDGYLQGVRALRQARIVMIADEVMSGHAANGSPSITGASCRMLTMAKGLTSACVPLSAVGRRPIADHFRERVCGRSHLQQPPAGVRRRAGDDCGLQRSAHRTGEDHG
jgi:taurine--2-oxoglutarate transaminase